jgi:peptide deformylase
MNTSIITELDALRQTAEPLEFITEQGIQKEEGNEIIEKILQIMREDPQILALSAPQIGINKRIIGIRFSDIIKIFIDPIILKKNNYKIAPETFLSMPGKEILINRPEELTIVYYTDDFKYEENKLLEAAARLFDQQVQLLDGILPDELGLVSDVEQDGSLADLNEEEIAELITFYKEYIKVKSEAVKQTIVDDPDLMDTYNKLAFSEKVINGKAALIAEDGTPMKQKAQAKTALKLKKIANMEKQANQADLKQFLARKGK